MRMRAPTRRTLLAGAAAVGLAGPAPGPLRALTGEDADALRGVRAAAEPLPDPADPAFGAAFDRYGDARVVLLGEETHGTSEFYRARAAITKRLILEHGVTAVAVEADWPDAAHVDAWIRGGDPPAAPRRPFRRFPTWMWRNAETAELVDWLRAHNARIADPARRVSFHGLDLYGLPASLEAAPASLARIDPAAAEAAREDYACFEPWREDPDRYALAPGRGDAGPCAARAGAVLERLQGMSDAVRGDPARAEAWFDAWRNARAIVAAERYYRLAAESPTTSWNRRDEHMLETLEAVLAHRGGKAVVWAHNSHVGDASATDRATVGEHNLGQLARARFGAGARLIGFGTDRGTVMAASGWGGEPEVMTVRPSLEDSVGALLRQAGPDRFLLDLRPGARPEARDALDRPRLERAIGVLYLPRTERLSHYVEASLSAQFDGFVWFEESRAVTPLDGSVPAGHPLAE